MDNDDLICPITLVQMADPVIDREGNTYERSSIERWVREHGTSPLTNRPLTLDQLHPNRAIKRIIDSLSNSNIPMEQPKIDGVEEIGLELDINHLMEENLTHFKISSIDSDNSTPANISLGIDTSGSMSAEAKIKTTEPGSESTGLNMLDIVIYSSKAIIDGLSPIDHLSIIEYSSTALVRMTNKPMTPENKKEAFRILDGMNPSGQTNIWECLEKGLELTRNLDNPYQNNMFLLLTDGEETIKPPRGTPRMLERYKQQYGKQNCSITTCLFGYRADVDLMEYISKQYNGNTLFIPDSGTVGTNFINLVSNVLSTKAVQTKLSIDFDNSSTTIDTSLLDNKYDYQMSENRLEIDIGNVHYGQSRDILLNINSSNIKDCMIKMDYIDVKQQTPKSMDNPNIQVIGIPAEELNNQMIRYQFVELLHKILDYFKINPFDTIPESFRIEMLSGFEPVNDYQKSIFKDVNDQVKEAISRRDWWDRWGKPYFINLAKSHILQECSNFKDESLQLYGGSLFRKFTDIIEDTFTKLPPPIPKRNVFTSSLSNSYTGSRYPSPSPPAPVNMSVYNNRSNPCFGGKSKVLMADNTIKLVEQLTKNDVVYTPNGNATIECVVKTNIPNNISIDLVELGNGLEITPYHPVRLDQWRYPIDIGPIKNKKCPAVYSFVLDKNHIMKINGIECCTLAHNFQDNEVIKHHYLGTSLVIDDLKSMVGWDNGLVELQYNCLVRDTETQLITKLIQY